MASHKDRKEKAKVCYLSKWLQILKLKVLNNENDSVSDAMVEHGKRLWDAVCLRVLKM